MPFAVLAAVITVGWLWVPVRGLPSASIHSHHATLLVW